MSGGSNGTGRMAVAVATAVIAGLAAPATAQDVGGGPALSGAGAGPEAAIACPGEPAPAFVLPTTGLSFTLPPDPDRHDAGDCAAPTPPLPARPPAPDLFSMAAVPVGKVSPQRKWEQARFGALADHPGPWDELLAQASQVAAGNPVPMINQWVNWHVRYRDDAGGDEWANAGTTLERGFGDCEDFALAKMALLAALGIPADEMFLVLLRDGRAEQHAVLVVNRDSRRYVLDNRTDKLLTADQIDDYTPILSFSGPFAWTYGNPSG